MQILRNLLWKPFDSTFSSLQEKLSNCDTLVDKEVQLYQLDLLLHNHRANGLEGEPEAQTLNELHEQQLVAIESVIDKLKEAVKDRHIGKNWSRGLGNIVL